MRFLPAAPARYDAAVIGGGFVGCQLALALRRRGSRVVVLERADDILCGASAANQARVHNGYHYPRSLLTALRSRVNASWFAREYAGCVDETFDHYYAVASRGSKVTSSQFET